MRAFAEIRRNADGIIRRHETEWWDDVENPDFIWSEGDFACDCNRALFFARAAGEDDPDRECGSEAFSLRVLDEAGSVLYADDAW